MESVGNYTLLEKWKDNDHQSLYMAVKSDDESHIGLANIIHKDDLLSDETFNILVRNLTNLVYYENNDNYCLVTNYNEGTPLSSYLNNYHPEEEKSIEILTTMLKKMSDYYQLPEPYLNLLVDEDQIIISGGEIEFNEIILLDKLSQNKDFHLTLQEISEQLFHKFDSEQANAIKAYFSSDTFIQENNLKQIYKQYLSSQKTSLSLNEDESVKPDISKDPAYSAPFLFSSEDATPEEFSAKLSLDSTAQTPDDLEPHTDAESKGKDVEDTSDDIPENGAAIIISTEDGEDIKKIILTDNGEPETPIYHTEITGEPPVQKIKKTSNNASKYIIRRRVLVAMVVLCAVLIGSALLRFTKSIDTTNDYTLDFSLNQQDDGWKFINSDKNANNPDILTFIWTVVKDDKLMMTSTNTNMLFKPTQDGKYIVTMTAVDRDGSTRDSLSKIVTKSNTSVSVSTPTPAQNNRTSTIIRNDVSTLAKKIYIKHNPTSIVSTSPESTTDMKVDENSTTELAANGQNSGQIISDKNTKRASNISNRITKPNDQFYLIKEINNQNIVFGDTLSMWLKTSNGSRAQIKIEGYNNNQQIIDQTINFTPKVKDFDLFLYAIDKEKIDHLKIYIKSNGDYVWYEGIIVQSIK